MAKNTSDPAAFYKRGTSIVYPLRRVLSLSRGRNAHDPGQQEMTHPLHWSRLFMLTICGQWLEQYVRCACAAQPSAMLQ